jgi:hypothetical protein
MKSRDVGVLDETLKLLVVSNIPRRNALSPFFQTIKVIAAILRARVRRAISGNK